MKSIVMEIDGRHAVVLNDTGDFIRIKNRNYQVGQRIENRRPAGFRRMRTAIAAAAAALILFAAGGTYAYCAPYTEVSLDVNPSIVLKLNYFNRVIGVTAMNDDAQRVLGNLDLMNDDIETATGEVVDALSAQGFILANTDEAFMVTANSQDQTRAREMLEAAERRIEQRTQQLRIRASVTGECIGQELVTRAREYGVSPGKLRLVEKYALSTGDPASVDVAAWLTKPVKEIIAATKENRKATQGSDSEGNAANGNGNAGNNGATNGNGSNDAGNGNNGSTTPAPAATPRPSSGGGSQSGSGYGRPSTAPNPTCTSTCSPVCTGDANQNQNGQNNGDGKGSS